MIMRKMIISLCLLMLISVQITGCTTAPNSIKNENKISMSTIKEIAYQYLSENEKNSIIDWKNALVSESKISSDHTVASLTGAVNLKGKDTYIITFTTNNASLGPITIYVDKNSHKVLGVDLRD